jgi:hypothetical protein
VQSSAIEGTAGGARTKRTSWSFGYTGGVQSFTMPGGVEHLTTIALGAGGGLSPTGAVKFRVDGIDSDDPVALTG